MNQPESTRREPLPILVLGALGVVYGDIGTSPLYTVKEVFSPSTGVPLDPSHLMGAASTIFWALMVIVTIKYVTLILRADNRGEGGIMALTALASQTARDDSKRRSALLLVGLFGAALFYGDSIITPAISVLSAVEGLEIATPALSRYVLPISVVVLTGLFVVQRHGTSRVGKVFGPVMVFWFALLAGAGAVQVWRHPSVLRALDPSLAFRFLAERGLGVFPAMGAIVLALTGAEALYADMGHFGKLPIRIAWTGLVLPALTLNYLGQCALLTSAPAAIDNPFFRLFPDWALLPCVILSALATVIASQAVISGAYSMTKEAIQLGFLPRMQVLHTSAREIGQIYLPQVNWFLLVAVLLATIGFGSSSALASAYGIAVTMTMLITTVLAFFVVRYRFGFSLPVAAGATAFFLVGDALLVLSCSLKIAEGGWFPLLVGVGLFAVMTTWHRGRMLVQAADVENNPELRDFFQALSEGSVARVPGIAVFAVTSGTTAPQALLHNLKHNRVLHETNVLVVLDTEEQPYVPEENQVRVERLATDFWRIWLTYGFKDVPDLPAALKRCLPRELEFDPMRTSYFLSQANVVPGKRPGMARWRETLFAAMARNAGSAAEYLNLPNNGVVVLGSRVEI
jgi:KUP system potassium uptake protein